MFVVLNSGFIVTSLQLIDNKNANLNISNPMTAGQATSPDEDPVRRSKAPQRRVFPLNGPCGEIVFSENK